MMDDFARVDGSRPAKRGDPVDAWTLTPLLWAYVGDAVYELDVRGRAALTAPDADAPQPHRREVRRRVVARVRAEGQARSLLAILPLLSDAERDLVRRGRNAGSGRLRPRGVSVQAYRLSTGLEALLGYLYLAGEQVRLAELLDALAAAPDANAARLDEGPEVGASAFGAVAVEDEEGPVTPP